MTAAAELGCTVAGEAGIGHKAQEEVRHIAGHRAAGTAGEEEGLGCSRTGAWKVDQQLHVVARFAVFYSLLLIPSTVSSAMRIVVSLAWVCHFERCSRPSAARKCSEQKLTVESDATVQCLGGSCMLIASKVVSDVAVVRGLWSCVCERGLDAGAGRQCTGQRLLRVCCRFEACRSRRRGVVCVVSRVQSRCTLVMVSIQALTERTEEEYNI